MKKYISFLFLFICFISCHSNESGPDGESQYRAYAPDGIPFMIAETSWKADGFGNHRAVVRVNEKTDADAVVAELPWRRPDMRPETKKVIVVDAATGNEIDNVKVIDFSSEKGSIAFQPITVPGEYYIYYLPYKYRKGWGDARYGEPWNDYIPPVYSFEKSWSERLVHSELPKAKVIRFESRSRFDSFTPMGNIATREEMNNMREQYPENPIIFTEDRAYPIRLTHQIPVRWVNKGPSDHFSGESSRNEYYVWQIGVWAAHKQLKNVKLQFDDFINGNDIISKKEITCFNQEGINWDGKPVSFTVNVPHDKVQALWCGIQIPENAKSGIYKGKVTLTAEGILQRTIPVEIKVNNHVILDKGDGELWRHARLRWLNSTIGEDNLPVAPYQPMIVDKYEINATDKQITIGKNGLPEKIEINGHQILAAPLKFMIETNGVKFAFNASNANIKKEADGLVKWNASSEQEGIRFTCNAYMEYDGYIRYNLKVSAHKELNVEDIQLITSYTPYASHYFMGTGFKGGFRPVNYSWDWKGPWDSYWTGNEKAGLHMEYRGGTYHGPLLNDYKPEAPPIWANGGKGSVNVTASRGQNAIVTASTGKNTITPQEKDFEFALLITPVKEVNSAKHFSERYYHAEPIGFDKAAEEGANIANIHHSKDLNPFINYPFIVRDSLIRFIEHQHTHGRKVKLYYTIRELTNYVEEVYALKSLNHEIFAGGVGYGLPWHCEHLIDDYKAAWYTELEGETSDAALVLSGFSRWINYYLEGLRWMFENYKIDGIYMDDVSFDRTVMKRMRKIMAEYRPEAVIDLHSNTGYSIGPANQYTDFFPYVDRLWFGESFKYNQMTPDEWFVTFSGIPFGQMSEMLQDGGNRFLGMVYGTTARHSYGKYSPAPVWDLWKSFGIEEAKMTGYWDEDCAITTNHPDVKATTYVKPGKVLISIGNFNDNDQQIRLKINWQKIGINPDNAKLTAPLVKDFQPETVFDINDIIPVKAKEGWLLILSE